MLYLNELPRPRPRIHFVGKDDNQKLLRNWYQRRLQSLNQQQQQQQLSSLMTGYKETTTTTTLPRLLWNYLKEYCEYSTLHGIRFLTSPKLQYFERFIWLLLLLFTTACAMYVYDELSNVYLSERIFTSVDDSAYPIFRIPAPSVAICPINRIDWPKLTNEAPALFLGENSTSFLRDVFIGFFSVLSNMHLNRLDFLAAVFENETLAANLHQLDHINVTEVMRYITLPCHDVIRKECIWRRVAYNCCDLFTLQNTEAGFCHIFNSAVSEESQERARTDHFYPYHNNYYGEGRGLDVTVELNETKTRPGIRLDIFVMVKQPDQWHDDIRFVSTNTYTKVILTPRITTADVRVRGVPPQERKCLFNDEKDYPSYRKIPGLRYWRGNCVTRCHQDYANNLCQCTPTLYFPSTSSDTNFTACNASSFRCLYENRNVLSFERRSTELRYVEDASNESMVCDCINSCDQYVYDKIFYSTPLVGDEIRTWSSLHLDIFYQSNYMIKYETRMRFTFVELLANFGGTIGLFLGASLLSAVELIYYFTIGLYIYLHNNWKQRQQRNQEVTKAQRDIQHLQRTFINSFTHKKNSGSKIII